MIGHELLVGSDKRIARSAVGCGVFVPDVNLIMVEFQPSRRDLATFGGYLRQGSAD